MKAAECRYCRLPVKIREVEASQPVYCCSGCALLDRLAINTTAEFPVTPGLVVGLFLGFAYFNQLLGWVLAILMAGEGKTEASVWFALASQLLAVAVWLTITMMQVRHSALSRKDFVIGGASLLLLIVGGIFGSLACLAGANLFWIVWSARGLLRRRHKPA